MLEVFFHPAAELLSDFHNFDILEDMSSAINGTNVSSNMVGFFTQSQAAYVTMDLLKAVLIIIIGLLLLFQFIPMLVDTVRRYVVLFFLMIFGPLFFACGASEKEKLSSIAFKYTRASLNNLIGFILKLFFISLSITATSNFFEAFIGSGALSAGKDYTPYQLIGFFCIVLCTYRLSNKFGSIMDALGFGPSLGFDTQFGSTGEVGGSAGQIASGLATNQIRHVM